MNDVMRTVSVEHHLLIKGGFHDIGSAVGACILLVVVFSNGSALNIFHINVISLQQILPHILIPTLAHGSRAL